MDKMNDKIVYTPGPSEVRENVRLKRAEKTTCRFRLLRIL